jgi:glycosyltransferase involved in cell wall biosynthesis
MILSDIPGTPGQFWGDHTTFVGPYKPARWLVRSLGSAWAWNLVGVLAAVRLVLQRHRCRGVVTSGGASGLFFAWLQVLVPWGRKPHVMIDCLWYVPGNRWRAALQRCQVQLAAHSVSKFVVWAQHEVEDYARAFGLPSDKFCYIPFHHTLKEYQYRVEEKDYLFAGGDADRDYPMLLEAVRPLPMPVWIASTRSDLFRGVTLPSHVRVEATTHAGFREAMAAARLVVVPMKGGLLHSGGQQTLLNALVMGKPTIVVGRRWPADLLTDGEHGLIVDYGDVEGLRRAITWVTDHPDEARAMGRRGQAHAESFTTRRCMEAIYDLVLRDQLQARPMSAARTETVGVQSPELAPNLGGSR